MTENKAQAASDDDGLGAFLRSRRAAVTPEQLGIEPSYGAERRVPGLRREEIAERAGVSVTYYTRLEQGERHDVSDALLDSLAKALRLTRDEHAHLYRLARSLPAVKATGETDLVREPVRALIASSSNAAVLVGRRTDVLAGNSLGYALWNLTPADVTAIGTSQAPNQARRVFLDPSSRALFPEWEHQADDLASYLRLASASSSAPRLPAAPLRNDSHDSAISGRTDRRQKRVEALYCFSAPPSIPYARYSGTGPIRPFRPHVN